MVQYFTTEGLQKLKDELKDIYKIVKDGMEDIIELKVPVEAHIEVGKNWLEQERYKG